MQSNAIEFHDIPRASTSLLKPFFHVELPLSAPGVNQSYKPAKTADGRLTLVHTDEANVFLEQIAWLFRDQSNIKYFDRSIFVAISTAHEKVPLDIDITFHMRTLWKSDIDGPVKIVLDALFEHFKFMTGMEPPPVNWNDNRITCLHIYKDVATSGSPSIDIEVRCVVGK